MWNNDNAGGTPPNAPPSHGFSSFHQAYPTFPNALVPENFVQDFHLRHAQVLGNDGQGETIALLELSRAFDVSAYQNFNRQMSTRTLQLEGNDVVLSTIRPVLHVKHNIGETMLDAEWAHVIAPKARLLVLPINESPKLFRKQLKEYHVTVVSDSLVPVGSGRMLFDNPFLLANGKSLFPALMSNEVQNVTYAAAHYPFFASSGDGGNNVTPLVRFPYAVVVGGLQWATTSRNPSDLTPWINEGYGTAVLSVKASILERQIFHQAWRTVPTVTWLAGYPGVWIDSQNGYRVVYGTSLSTPCWAALWALADAAHIRQTHTHLSSNAYLTLLQLAQQHPDAFWQPHTPYGHFSALVGLGMPNPKNLVEALAHAPNSTSTVLAQPWINVWKLLTLMQYIGLILCSWFFLLMVCGDNLLHTGTFFIKSPRYFRVFSKKVPMLHSWMIRHSVVLVSFASLSFCAWLFANVLQTIPIEPSFARPLWENGRWIALFVINSLICLFITVWPWTKFWYPKFPKQQNQSGNLPH
ncbi:hypothetical protein FY534_07750 [Alicyclobacillus sp. TC]|uniref:hypothetical protein n=1 Tax=Alicyclobacillus sp. TC TaxID=2606450 RepID=UPI00193128B9|nr:hypothetical protein [Alicyclobacillus sp. TC]QRF23574.1 hypothetical protein FY534_07750 [Alicyclobacillus sp. TC]